MKREILFRGKRKSDGAWVYGDLNTKPIHHECCILENGVINHSIDPETVGQYIGLEDKKGNKIFDGDRILYYTPYRTTQTHYGDNIPNGAYTEPMEPGIKIHEGVVVFEDGMFKLSEDENFSNGDNYPLHYAIRYWSLEDIKEAISYSRPDRFIFDDPEEGDLQYLMDECAKVKTPEELIEHLNGITVIGNIYDNPDGF